MSMATRRIVHDDHDSNTIQYGGQWFTKTSAGENIGNFGPPYLYTLHGTNRDARIVLEFNGTEIEVYGTSIVDNPKTNPDPTLECFIDGVSIGREPPFEFSENNWKLCGKGGFTAGPHKLTVNIKVQSPNQTFWLDQIRYTPSPGVSLDNKMIMLTNTDPAIRLDDSWNSLASFKATSESNAVAHVDFIGTSVSWVGYIPVELPHGSASGTYSIDGGKPVNFVLVGVPGNTQSSQFNQVFFTTPEVDSGPHTLTVTFLGSGSTTPLTLDRLYISNGTLATNSNSIPTTNTAITSAPSATDTTTLDTANDRGESGLNIGALLGGILGGLALVIIIAGILLYRRHRRLSKCDLLQRFTGEPSVLMPYDSYRDFPVNNGPRNAPIPGSVPPPGNQSSAKRREAFRVEIRPTRQFHGGSDGAAGPSNTTGDHGFGQARTDSGIRPDGPFQVRDIPPPRYILD